jgi:hypothetical protein
MLSQHQGHSAAGRIMATKNSKDTIGNRTRDLPDFGAVPQSTASPRSRHVETNLIHFNAMQCTNRPFIYRFVPIRRQNFHAWRIYFLKMGVAISSETSLPVHTLTSCQRPLYRHSQRRKSNPHTSKT